ncbi:hypothetical protein [Desulfuribacillus alkaliarsenatis]|uniref:Uncharacterized protein n=1 Tax=Desulfuribacillus alkaliarsenatis TaxID=766136 RepID=A0A1E5G5C7_9FIRM|nr:hypothetical protein [Desulfuribacillus alkaliarsenatis]OEF98363.1 hypothetical protein BHF68_01415 [Desulfuribacillus alkaliarsenatis]
MEDAITLAEALPLRASIKNTIADLQSERNQVATVIYEKGDDYELPSRNFEQVTEEIEQVAQDLRMLENKIALANLQNTVDWSDEKLSIHEAIMLAQYLRQEANELLMYSKKKKVSVHRDSYGINLSKSSIQEKTLYDPDTVRNESVKLTRKANKLSSMIDAANHSITINFDADRYMGY